MIDKPPDWRYTSAVALVALVTCYWSSLPHPYEEADALMIFVGVPLALYWVVRLFLALMFGSPRKLDKRLLHWLPAPLILLTTWAVIDADLPFQARFTISRPALEAHARTVFATEGRHRPACQWDGLFPVCASYGSTGVHLHIQDWPRTPARSFVWLPEGEAAAADPGHRHLGGPWYGVHSAGTGREGV